MQKEWLEVKTGKQVCLGGQLCLEDTPSARTQQGAVLSRLAVGFWHVACSVVDCVWPSGLLFRSGRANPVSFSPYCR